MKVNVSVVIPTYNNVKGLRYLLNYFKDKNYQVIVVDNKMSVEKKDFITLLLHCYKNRMTYLPQEKNLGFAGGVNKGAKNVETKWMLILNDDIEFENSKIQIPRSKQIPNSKLEIKNSEILQKLIQFAEKNYFDAVTPVLRNPDGKVENFGYKVLPYGKIELIRNSKQILNTKYEILNTNLDGLTAACLLIKTEVFKKLNGFDESFFAYLEDVDFFLRFKKAGYKMSIANVEVLHNHMTTTSTMGNFKAKQDMINWWRLFLKHPDKFKFNLAFIVERLRNVSRFIKASLK